MTSTSKKLRTSSWWRCCYVSWRGAPGARSFSNAESHMTQGTGWPMEWFQEKSTWPWLVGGWFTPLKNMKVNWDDEIPNIWENKIDVPNHQPAMILNPNVLGEGCTLAFSNTTAEIFTNPLVVSSCSPLWQSWPIGPQLWRTQQVFFSLSHRDPCLHPCHLWFYLLVSDKIAYALYIIVCPCCHLQNALL